MADNEGTERALKEELEVKVEVLDEFEKNAPPISKALNLMEKSHSIAERLYGLKVVEHAVKHRWGGMPLNEKMQLKMDIMSMVSNGTKHILLEHSDVKDGYARIVLEMIKHDWPDSWPTLLKELDSISKKQETQEELVLLILLRLAECVASSQKERFSRGPELQRALVLNMKELLKITVDLLMNHLKRYKKLKTDRFQSMSTSFVLNAALDTLAGYIGWLGMWHVANQDYKLLSILWEFLNESELQLAAADCLLVAINRMGKLKSIEPLMVLFGNDALPHILSAAKITSEGPIEKKANLLKKMCLIVCAMGRVLCSLMGSDTPANFGKYLECLMAFTEQSNQVMSFSTHSTWKDIFHHKVLSCDPKLKAILPNYLSSTMTNLEKAGFDLKTDTADSGNVPIKMAADDDYNASFQTFHDQQREMIKMACRVHPMICFEMATGCLKYQMTDSEDLAPIKSESSGGPSSISISSLVRWKAMTFFFETVVSEIFQVMSKERIPVHDIQELMIHAMRFETKDPVIWSCFENSISTLFVCFSDLNTCSTQVFTLLFEIIEVVKDPKAQIMKTIRRYAFACLIKLCQGDATYLLTHFEELFNRVKYLMSNELLLTGIEKSVLTKCLVLLSNQFKNYDRQKAFFEELLEPVAALWLSSMMDWLLTDALVFIPHVGGNLPIDDIDLEGPTELYRSRISYCVSSILEVLKWTQLPTDLDESEAEAGGFVTGYMLNGKPIYRNPCTEPVMKLMNNVFNLIRVQHNIFLPEVMDTIGDTLAIYLQNLDPKMIYAPGPHSPPLDLYNPPVYNTGLERMQHFFDLLYGSCCSILGQLLKCEEDFYIMEDLVGKLLNSALFNLEYVPSYKLLTLFHRFVKPLVISCPPEFYESLVTPVLGPFLTAVHVRLTNDWHVITEKPKQTKKDATNTDSQEAVAGSQDDVDMDIDEEDSTSENPESMDDKENSTSENPESQEIVDEAQLRVLTQEIMKFIEDCCLPFAAADSGDAPAKSDDDKKKATDVDHQPELSYVPTDLAVCLMKDEVARSALLVTAFTSLSWPHKTRVPSDTHLCWSLLNHVILEPLNSDAVTYFFTMVLKGLEAFENDSVYIDNLVHLAFQIYMALRPRYEDLKEVMIKIPNINKFYQWTFDKKLLGGIPSTQGPVERKTTFTNLIKGCIRIRKPLCEKKNKEANISDSPPALKKQKTIPPSSMETTKVLSPSDKSTNLTPPSVDPKNIPPPAAKPKNFTPSSVKRKEAPTHAVELKYLPTVEPFVEPQTVPPPSDMPTYFSPPTTGPTHFQLPSVGLTNIPPPSVGLLPHPQPSVGLLPHPQPSVELTNCPPPFMSPNTFPPPFSGPENPQPHFGVPNSFTPPFSNPPNSFTPPFSNPLHPLPYFRHPNIYPPPYTHPMHPPPYYR